MEKIVDVYKLDDWLQLKRAKSVTIHSSLITAESDANANEQRAFLVALPSIAKCETTFKLKFDPKRIKRKRSFVALKGTLSILGENGFVFLVLEPGHLEVGEHGDEFRYVWTANVSSQNFERFFATSKRLTFLSELWGIFENTVEVENSANVIEANREVNEVSTKDALLFKMFLVENLCDFTIFVDGHSIKCHKSVLISESDVFEAMFESDFKENRESCMRIDEFSYEAVHSMLKFMYCHEVDNIKDLVFDLLLLSDKYNVKKLKILCENYISSKIKLDNFFRIYQMATYNNTPILKQNLREFLHKNHESLLQQL
ncbi:protein roadkill-like isoform X1 [Dinothrombium tinctorium]|uniref:Protein roadkill-like isoform X1 n=1 Tax=Dinothrombium tinctorium TaxID=1965070 RepID=A0A443RM32_9ACAR|nr:protein roadkill-like isoform X1 [Dinothrombium tinctorium]